jgi:hypothetical protein
MAVASNNYPTLLWSDFGVLAHLWSQNDINNIDEADSHLKLLPVLTLDIYKVFQYIDMLSTGIWQYPQTVIPTLLGSDFGVLAHLLSQNDVIVSWLKLTATSNCFLHPY